jgi:hypothetical protein
MKLWGFRLIQRRLSYGRLNGAIARDYNAQVASYPTHRTSRLAPNSRDADNQPRTNHWRYSLALLITDKTPSDFCLSALQGESMQLQQKLGYGFILFGLAMIIGLYFLADGGAYIFSALLGLMAIVFGGFQLMLVKQLPIKPAKVAVKSKRARR